jgi:hypothetical protein
MSIVGLVAFVDVCNNWISIVNNEACVDVGFLAMEFGVTTNNIENCFEAITDLDRQRL